VVDSKIKWIPAQKRRRDDGKASHLAQPDASVIAEMTNMRRNPVHLALPG